MKKLWTIVNQLSIKREMKNRLFILFWMLLSAMMGGALWGVLGRIFLPEISWLICFIGYPTIFLGFFGAILYLYNHEFA